MGSVICIQECLPHTCLDRLSVSTPKKEPFPAQSNRTRDALSEYRGLNAEWPYHVANLKYPWKTLPRLETGRCGRPFQLGRTHHSHHGVGNLYGLRLNCRPEISLLKLSGIS